MHGELKIAAREVGNLPLSIPTSIAIEALFEVKITENALYVNIRSLFRNMWNSVDPDYRERSKGVDYVSNLLGEIAFLRSYIAEKTNGLLQVVFYYCSYLDLERKLPCANLKQAMTAKQRIYMQVENDAMVGLLKHAKEVDIKQYITDIRGEGKIIILTHAPVDLLFTHFFSVVLLESFTGKLKKSFEWNTKLTNGSSLSNIPFNKFTVQIFGDNNTYIAAMPFKIKQAVLEMATKDRWTATTTIDKMRFSINQLRDNYAKNFLLKVLKS